jgi:hypothetical protein
MLMALVPSTEVKLTVMPNSTTHHLFLCEGIQTKPFFQHIPIFNSVCRLDALRQRKSNQSLEELQVM